MTKFVNICWLVSVCYVVESFTSLEMKDDENIHDRIHSIEEISHLEELLVEIITIKEPGSCKSDSECLPGGRCIGIGKNGKICRCFRGVSGDYCNTFEECVRNPLKCGGGTDVECSYDPNNKIPYCKCNGEGRRFDVTLKKCVDQEQCKEDKECKNAGECKGETVKYCKCKPGTHGDYCENIEECENNPNLCGTGNDVKCKFNYFLKRAFCHCLNGTNRFEVTQKKCVKRNSCLLQEECGTFGVCTETCQSFEPCKDNEYFEGLSSCHCVEGMSGERCEIVDDCYNKVVDCGTSDNVECRYRYVRGISGSAFCKCTKDNQKFDRISKTCRDCDCGPMASACSFENGKKVCSCNSQSYNNGDKCEDCECGEGANGCEIKDGKKECICKTGFLLNKGACKKCDCGDNSTGCKFENGLKICSCKPGFTMGNYGVCTPVCNDTRQCENGGRCLQNICVCLAGTTGPFCERIYECENKLCGVKNNVYCKYNIQTEKAYCQCRDTDAIYDPFDESCKVCTCDTFDRARFKISWDSCEFVKGKRVCHCKKGYAIEPKLDICYKCSCGSNLTCEFDADANKVCRCDEGFIEWEGSCIKCDCGNHGTCKLVKARFQPVSLAKFCDCEPGYEDFQGTCIKCDCGPNGRCVFNSKGETIRCDCYPEFAENSKKCQACYCGPDSNCSYINEKKECECPKGYRDVRGYCERKNECSCGPYGSCIFSSKGEIIRCDCEFGFADDSKTCKFCFCGPDSNCTYKDRKKVCDCPNGYQDIKSYCVDIDECLKPYSCPTPGMLCINTPGSFRCVCKPGYLDRNVEKNNSTPLCEKQEEKEKTDSFPLTIICVIAIGYFLLLVGLIAILFKIRRLSKPIVTQQEMPLGKVQNSY